MKPYSRLSLRLAGADAVHMDMAGIRLLEIRNDAQKRGLTATRRADEGNELAFVDLQVHVGESINRTIRSLIGQRQSANVDDGGSRMACDRPSVGGNRSGAVPLFPEFACHAL